jgi:DNA-binding HxlR family transcriptional regulator
MENLSTATEKKTCAKCPCMEVCPLEKALRIIGGKWKVLLLCALQQDGTSRYSDLKRKIKGITATMLASSLKELEASGLVTRTQYSGIPVRVEYSLTPEGNDLLPILSQLAHWGARLNQEAG